MNSYIVCLESADAPPLFEIAICASEAEARDWAANLLAYAPGFEVTRILSPPLPDRRTPEAAPPSLSASSAGLNGRPRLRSPRRPLRPWPQGARSWSGRASSEQSRSLHFQRPRPPDNR